MRAGLAHSLRPRIGPAPSILSHIHHAPVRRTSFPRLKRTLKLCDAFTILLAPVLTAAFVADIISKDKRRQEWDQKLAQLQQEIDTLREQELQSWNALQWRSIQSGVAHQRRAYSTAASAKRGYQIHDDTETGNTESERIDAPAFHDDSDRSYEINVSELQHYENLLARRVAYQLLLYICGGHDPSAKAPLDGLVDFEVVPNSMDNLLKHLTRVEAGLRELRPRVSEIWFDTDAASPQRRDLDEDIQHFTSQCRTGMITINDLVYAFTRAVINSSTGPSLRTYQMLAETFSTLDADALTFIAMYPYLRTRQLVEDRHIISMIQMLGKIKEPLRLEVFLKKLVGKRDFRYRTEWEYVMVDGVQVVAPCERHPRILDVLIRSALQSDQPHRARAWAILLVQTNPPGLRLANVFNNFLTHCARYADWMYGQLWLHRSISWLAFFAHESPEKLQILVFRMLDLCVACDQREMYNVVLGAAVSARLEPPGLDTARPDHMSDQAQAIRSDWFSRLKETRMAPCEVDRFLDAAKIFQTEVAKVSTAIHDFVGVVDFNLLRTLINNHNHQALTETDRGSASTIDLFRNPSHSSLPDDILGTDLSTRTLSMFSLQSTNGQPVAKEESDLATQPDSLKPAVYTSDVRVRRLDKTSDGAYLKGQLGPFQMQKAVNNFPSSKRITHQTEEGSFSPQPGFHASPKDEEKMALLLRTNYFDLLKELATVKAQNQLLKSEMEQAEKRGRQLDETNEELDSVMAKTRPKSLEAIFVEKENLNLRAELRAVSDRYLTTLDEKLSLEKDLAAVRLRTQTTEPELVP